MIFVLIMLAIFVAVSIYFFFRSEALSQQLRLAKREALDANQQNQAFIDTLALLASRHEEFAKFRLKSIKDQASGEQQKAQLELISPLLNNYSAIFQVCLKKGGQLKTVSQKYFKQEDKNGFNAFTKHIAKQEAHVKRMWSDNNFNGFISLVEALLFEAAKQEIKEE